jgi:hypothetical protein
MLYSAAVGHASFHLILLLLARFVCVNCFLNTNLFSFLLPECRLLVLLCCLIYVVCFAALRCVDGGICIISYY